jgi:hypothetical protein
MVKVFIGFLSYRMPWDGGKVTIENLYASRDDIH